MSSSQPPIGEGEFVFHRKPIPSFWSRLAQQKQGLGFMALSASCCLLALNIIRQDKEFQQAKEISSQLRAQNEELKERLARVKLAVQEEGGADRDLTVRLKDVLQIQDAVIPVPEDPKQELRKDLERTIKSKFMV